MKEKTLISISTGTIIRTLLIVVLFFVILTLKELVLLVLTAIIIASAVELMSLWLKQYKIPRWLSALSLYVIGTLLIVATFYFVVPRLLQESLMTLNKLQEYAQTTNTQNQFSLLVWKPLIESLTSSSSIRDVLQNYAGSISSVSGNFFKVATSFFGGVISFIVVIVLSFYLAVQEDGVGDFLRIITPVRDEKYIIDLWKRSQFKIGRWMQGQLLLTVIIGVLVYVGLLILGVRDALILAILSGFCELIPLFGPIIALVPAVLLSYLDGGWTLALFVTGLYLIVHQLENQLIYPMVVKKVVGVNPVVVIISLIAGYELAGFLGLIVSVPLAAIGMELVRDIQRDRLSTEK